MTKLLKPLIAALPLVFFAYPVFACSSDKIFDHSAFCHTGFKCLFSTIAWQFLEMVNTMIGKLYCDIQDAAEIVVKAAIVLFICVYGIQVVTGVVLLNGREAISRILKMSVVYFVVAADSAWQDGMAILLGFFIDFIMSSTGWMMSTLPADAGGGGGVAGLFKFMDDLVTGSFGLMSADDKSDFTGLKRDQAIGVMFFFVNLAYALPTFVFIVIYFAISLFTVCMRTMISFLVAIIAIGLLITLAPIFVSFMLFRMTFRFFETWIKFMTSFALQVMLSFAVLSLYLNSLYLFKDFFIELANMVGEIKISSRHSASTYWPFDTYGVCDMDVEIDNGRPSAKCKKGGTSESDPPRDILATSVIPQQPHFVFYLFYHMITLIIISHGFATLQKNMQQFCSRLAGPQWVPYIGGSGTGSSLQSVLYGADAKRIMSGGNYRSFNQLHEAKADPIARAPKDYVRQFTSLVTKR